MMQPPAPLDEARQRLGISVLDLWWTYFALGGNEDAYALTAYLNGQSTPTTATHNTIVHALNQTFGDRGQNSPVPYQTG